MEASRATSLGHTTGKMVLSLHTLTTSTQLTFTTSTQLSFTTSTLLTFTTSTLLTFTTLTLLTFTTSTPLTVTTSLQLTVITSTRMSVWVRETQELEGWISSFNTVKLNTLSLRFLNGMSTTEKHYKYT